MFQIGEVIEIGNLPIVPPIELLGGKTMNGKVPLISRDWVQYSFKNLVDRQMSKRRRDERRLAEQRTTKHQFEARKPCVADARNYRIARKFPVSAAAQLDWETIIPAGRPIFGSAWLKKFREDQFKHWLTVKQGS
jgi:hypothetical protein